MGTGAGYGYVIKVPYFFLSHPHLDIEFLDNLYSCF